MTLHIFLICRKILLIRIIRYNERLNVLRLLQLSESF
jgi:hypothetical protein